MLKVSAIEAQLQPSPPADVLAKHYVRLIQAQDATFREDYRLAESLFATVCIQAPEHPVGYLMHAAAIQAEMMDHEKYDRNVEFLSLLDSAQAKAEAWIESHPGDPWGYCFMGHVYGYRAVSEARDGSWFTAVKLGFKAKGAYHDALKRDTTCIDAYVGLGSYHYWKSARTEFINWTGVVVKDDKEKGIAELKHSMESGYLCRPTAAVGLVWIYLDQGLLAEARDLARTWQARYPEGKTFLWGQTFAEFALGQDDSALAHFDSLKLRVAADSQQSYFNWIEIDSHRAALYERNGRHDDACALMDSILAYPADPITRRRQKGRLNDARKFIEKNCTVEP
jgi:hypothetical protein